jgi:hypothetical protein
MAKKKSINEGKTKSGGKKIQLGKTKSGGKPKPKK